jgi:hypothetical protein
MICLYDDLISEFNQIHRLSHEASGEELDILSTLLIF